MPNHAINILLVEDDTLIGMGLRLELEREGYTVTNIAVTGDEALHAVAEEQPDVVLMDIQLAGNMDGIEAARHIQTNTDIPVIFMTSYHEQTIRERAQILKPLGYLQKPVRMYDLHPLLDAIRR